MILLAHLDERVGNASAGARFPFVDQGAARRKTVRRGEHARETLPLPSARPTHVSSFNELFLVTRGRPAQVEMEGDEGRVTTGDPCLPSIVKLGAQSSSTSKA
jgi:hypothetical protein